LVQVKRYAATHPIRIGAVQALGACVEDERANRGLFVTTSRYLPSAKRFAERQRSRISLATADDIVVWSEFAKKRIIRDKSQLVSSDHIDRLLLGDSQQGIEGKIFVS